MLYSVIVNFKAQADAIVSPTLGYHAYALFLDILRQSNETMAQKVHDLQGQKPFTLSPLQGRIQRYKSSMKVIKDEIYWIRMTFLTDDIFSYYLEALLKASGRNLRLDQAVLKVDSVLTAPGMSPLCKCEDFESIVSQGSEERQVHLRFFSPTAFRSGGKRNVLFPEPRLLFSSLLPKWQSFSPIKLDSDILAIADKGTRIARYRLGTRILHFGSYQEIGFEGSCSIEIADEVREQAVRNLNTLADFAFYCGSGAKTAMGMGQTRRMKYARALPDRTTSNADENRIEQC